MQLKNKKSDGAFIVEHLSTYTPFPTRFQITLVDIIKLLDAKAITQTQLPDVLTEWRTPRHREFSERQNVWRLFNACTEAVKGSLWKLPTRTQALQGILDGHCGLLSDAERN